VNSYLFCGLPNQTTEIQKPFRNKILNGFLIFTFYTLQYPLFLPKPRFCSRICNEGYQYNKYECLFRFFVCRLSELW